MLNMDMRTFLQTSTASERELLAKAVGTTVAYLYQIAGGHRDPSPTLAIQIHRAKDGLVSCHGLRPDIFPEGFVPAPEIKH